MATFYMNGNDSVNATSGSDTFEISPGLGDNHIYQFNPWNDKIDLTAFNGLSWDDVSDHISFRNVWDSNRQVTTMEVDLEDWGGGTLYVTMEYAFDTNHARQMFNMPDMAGTDAADGLYGTSAGETIYGHGGHDDIHGKGGDDTLYGGAGNDNLAGGAGDDVLIGGAGDDYLHGGSGQDVFVYGPGAGNDLLYDYHRNDGDRIDVSAFSDIQGFSDIKAEQVGASVVIDFSAHGGGTLTLSNCTLDDLDENDFIFVGDADAYDA